MADPLAALAEREIPQRTNFFDPEGARTVISRYAGNRRTGEDLARSYDRVSTIQDRDRDAVNEEARMKRQQLVWDRDDEDYFARKDALAKQGEFMERLGEIKGDDPDYDTKITSFLGGVPPELLEEPGIKAALIYKNQVADDARSRRNAEVSRQGQYDFWEKKLGKGAELKFDYIKPEDYADPRNMLDDGSPNLRNLQAINEERKRSTKRADFDYKAKAVFENRLKLADKMNMSRSARALRDDLETYIEDPGAFPRQSQSVLAAFRKEKKNPNATPDLMTGPWADRYAQAQAWDKKPFERELIAAQNYDDPEEYVRLGGEGLNENQKKYREKMWQLAHKEDVFDEVPAAGAPAAPSGGKKPLTREAAAQFKEQAKGDRAKAEQLAREAGFDF